MKKSILALCFSFSLAFSILAPSVSDLLNLDHDEITFIDSSEEESQKEAETSVDENVIIMESMSKISSDNIEESNGAFKFYTDDDSVHASSVHLPPPELNS